MSAPMDRLMSKVVYSDTFFAGTPCWIFTAGRDKDGYGRFWIDGRSRGAHRVTYSEMVGPIPSGYQIDHLCRTTSCCNPAHLEAVTPRVNTLRGLSLPAINAKKDYCPAGHPYDELNTRHYNSERHCRACHRRHSGWKGGIAPGQRTHCVNGHELTGDNVTIIRGNERRCNECHRQRQREYLERKRTQTTGNTAGDNNPAQPNERNTA